MAPSEDEKKVEWQYLPLTPLQDRGPRARDGIRNSLGPVEVDESRPSPVIFSNRLYKWSIMVPNLYVYKSPTKAWFLEGVLY